MVDGGGCQEQTTQQRENARAEKPSAIHSQVSEVNGPSTNTRWALVGCGWVARDFVAPALRASGRTRLAAACDPDPEALATVAPKGSSTARFAELGALLAETDVDAVYVATPNHTHSALVREAAEAGARGILCEKPMARTPAEAEAMLAACEKAGATYATAFDQRFHPAHRRLREMIAEGALGTVTQVRIHYACWTPPEWTPDPDYPHDNWRADPQRAGGGAFLDLAPHGLDLTQMLLGEKVAEATAFLQHRRVHDYDVDDAATLAGRTASGALLSLDVAYNCPDAYPRRRLEVIGTEARAFARNTMGQDAGGTLTLTRPDGSEQRVAFDQEREPFAAQIEAFTRALQAGEPFGFPPERDLHTMRLLAAAPSNATVS
jgi:predicted dehydrogenase